MARCDYCGTRRNVGQYGLGGTAEHLCGAHRKMQRQSDRGKGASSPGPRKEPAAKYTGPCPNGCGNTMRNGICPGRYC